MRRTWSSPFTLSALAFLVSCGGPTEPEPDTLALTVVSGDEQRWIAGKELPDPIVVLVTEENEDGRTVPVEGQLVNFRIVSGEGSVLAGAALTNGEGMARGRWTLGPEPGGNTLEVRADTQTVVNEVFALFTAEGRPFPEELTTVRALVDDAWVNSLAQRLESDVAVALKGALDLLSSSLGDVFDLDAADGALTEAQSLVEGAGPPTQVESAFLRLFVARSRILFDAAVETILGS